MDCAISRDCTWVISASRDKTVRAWDAATGQELLSVPLPGELHCVALHPSQPLAACGDSGGGFYLVELVGIELVAPFSTRSEFEPPALIPQPEERKKWQFWKK